MQTFNNVLALDKPQGIIDKTAGVDDKVPGQNKVPI